VSQLPCHLRPSLLLLLLLLSLGLDPYFLLVHLVCLGLLLHHQYWALLLTAAAAAAA
jgi:hypothetical protein